MFLLVNGNWMIYSYAVRCSRSWNSFRNHLSTYSRVNTQETVGIASGNVLFLETDLVYNLRIAPTERLVARKSGQEGPSSRTAKLLSISSPRLPSPLKKKDEPNFDDRAAQECGTEPYRHSLWFRGGILGRNESQCSASSRISALRPATFRTPRVLVPSHLLDDPDIH